MIDGGGYQEYEEEAPNGRVVKRWRRTPKTGLNTTEISVTDRHLHDLVDEGFEALARTNRPPWLFQHGGQIAEIQFDEQDRPGIFHLRHAALRGLLDRSAAWVVTRGNVTVPARPPRDVVEDMLARRNNLPVLRGITGTPVFTADGSLVTAPGYQLRTQLYYHPLGEAIPPVPKEPRAQDLERAKQLLCEDLFVDFPFVDQSSLANAIAAALTPVVREMIAGTTPLFAIDAPTPGSGKGLLAQAVGMVVCGLLPRLMTVSRGDEEQRKRITAALRDGTQVIQLDNIKQRLDSASLAAVLTAPEWTDRLLGKSEMIRVPNRSLWLATGNNLQFDGELTRRTVWIRLDTRADRPWEREGFRHDPLLEWVQLERHELVWALLVLGRYWIAKSRPAWSGRPLGSFESWGRIVGGILESAGIPGFLGNREELYRRVDAETEEWRMFVLAWCDRFGDTLVKAAELLELVLEQDLLVSLFLTAKASADERALRSRLGKALSQRRDRRFGDYFIERAGEDSHAKGAFYRLARADGSPRGSLGDERSASSADLPPDKESTPDTHPANAERAEERFYAEQPIDLEISGGEETPSGVPQLPIVDSDPGPLRGRDARLQATQDEDELARAWVALDERTRRKVTAVAAIAPDDSRVCWRVNEMRKQVSMEGPIPFLMAREGPHEDDACLSCGEALPGDFDYACPLCSKAKQVALEELRGPVPMLKGSSRTGMVTAPGETQRKGVNDALLHVGLGSS